MLYYEHEQIRLFQGDSLKILKTFPDASFDSIITDPPYFLSNGGFSNSGGKQVPVDKGNWDQLADGETAEDFYMDFLQQAKRLLSPNGTIWVFGTMHNIYSLGYLLNKLDFKILNNITWQKSNPAPNLGRRMFTHSTETILWAKKDQKSKQIFHYNLMRDYNDGKQMKDVWTTATINRTEKKFGNHPTQKPIALMERIIESTTNPDSRILDPFMGSGTTLAAGLMHHRSNLTGIELESKYLNIARQRLQNTEITLL